MDAVTLLWWLTGIYLAVLVLVLAVTLLSVAFYAWRIGSTLRQIAGGLAAVQGHTEPLNAYLAATNDGLGAIAASLTSARDHLVATDGALAALTEGSSSQQGRVA
jgi:hypothetical protein